MQVRIEKTHGDQVVESLLRQFRPDARASQGDTFWLALEATEPVGVLAGHHDWTNWGLLAQSHATDERASWIAELFVVPGNRDLGVGSALVEAFLEDARRTQNQIGLTWPSEADEHHRRRARFFARLGFDWAAVGTDHRRHDPWLMYRSLRTVQR